MAKPLRLSHQGIYHGAEASAEVNSFPGGSISFSAPEDADFEDGVMKKEEILRTLENCGLSEYESKVYSSLVFLGPSRAGLISRESDVPQSKIYEILEQLVHKQLVYVFEGRPKEYKAAEPRNALKHLLEARAKEIESLKTDIKAMSEFLKPVREDEVIGGIWTTKGQKFKEFFNMVTEMLERSEKYAYAISRDFSRSAGIGEVLRKCAKRGVKVRMIGMEPLEGDNYLKAKWYKDHGVEVRIFQTKVHPRIIVVDGKELLLRLDYNTKKRDRFIFSSVWSEDRSLVNVIDSYVKNMWDDAEPAKFQRNLPTMP